MLSKAKFKYISSLEQKKARRKEGAFVAEGPKVVGDMIGVFTPVLIVATKEWLSSNINIIPTGTEIIEVSNDELQRCSFLQHPQQVLAVMKMPEHSTMPLFSNKQLTLALDNVQDPGNLGTIIRVADWFGITNIVCSPGCADCYNPKVVQATMGSLARVSMTYTDLPEFLESLPEATPVYGTFLDGKDITEVTIPSNTNGIIVMGNEGNGISKDVDRFVSHRILIPNYPKDRPTADSLNVAIATAITCYHFRFKK